jgi:hypothetical protein
MSTAVFTNAAKEIPVKSGVKTRGCALRVTTQTHLLLYRRGLDARYGAGTADELEERYRDSHFKGKNPRKNGAKRNTKPKSSRSKKS